MKKIFFIVLLITGSTRADHANAQKTIPVFDIPDESFSRQFVVELNNKATMNISVTSMQVLDYISNIDSVLKLLVKELMKIKDSLSLKKIPLRVDYNMYSDTIKMLRVRKSPPPADYYAFIKGSPVILKIQQDTLVIYGKVPPGRLRKPKEPGRANNTVYYFSVAFYLNDFEDIYAYMDGRLNEKIRIIQQHYKETWQYRTDERMQLKEYPEITSNTERGYIIPPKQFSLPKSVEVQNYKDHFVPSVSCTPTYAKENDFIKREFGLTVETAFGFEKQANGSTKSRVNVFAGLTYNVSPLLKSRQWAKIYPYFNISYLVSRSGNIFDKNSFRLGLGNFSAGNLTTTLQPALYFSNLFRHVTPSLRIVQRF